MHKIKEMLMNELYEYEDKAEKAGKEGKLSAGDLEAIHKLTDTVKNIDEIEMPEEYGGYSGASEWMGDGRIYGTSYARGRGSSAKRDRMGRYSSDIADMHDGMRMGRESYARGRRYSRDGAKDHMIDKLEEMLGMAGSEKEKRAIHQCIEKLENA